MPLKASFDIYTLLHFIYGLHNNDCGNYDAFGGEYKDWER